MTKKQPELGTQLSFALYGAANRMVRLHKQHLEPLGLTFPQYLVMLELLRQAPQSVGAIGARVDMDTGTVTPLLKRLEVAGLITRVRDVLDERRVMVDLTARGRGLQSRIWGVTQKIKTACRLDDAGLDDLRRSLDALAHPLESSMPEGTKSA